MTKKIGKKQADMAKKKRDFLIIFKANNGMVTTSCEKAGISREGYYLWRKTDKKFAKAADEVPEKIKDFAENALMKKIRRGEIVAILFFLKTKCKDRGYVEKTEQDINFNDRITFKTSKPKKKNAKKSKQDNKS